MPRLTKIYTRTGDDGTTALGSRRRVSKESTRVTAYGDVDELNSSIGLALAIGLSPSVADALVKVQNELFNLGSDLAFPEEDKQQFKIPQIEARHVKSLEMIIDEITAFIGPLENFILPGGTPGAAQLHMARTTCRRAERAVVTLTREEPVGEHVLSYLNRLSDALFVMARLENRENGIEEALWDSRA
jgi:cob(I)alamin adenosyltransferase